MPAMPNYCPRCGDTSDYTDGLCRHMTAMHPYCPVRSGNNQEWLTMEGIYPARCPNCHGELCRVGHSSSCDHCGNTQNMPVTPDGRVITS